MAHNVPTPFSQDDFKEYERLLWSLCEINHDLHTILTSHLKNDDFLNFLKPYTLANNVDPNQDYGVDISIPQINTSNHPVINNISYNTGSHDNYIINYIFNHGQNYRNNIKQNFQTLGNNPVRIQLTTGTLSLFTDRKGGTWQIRSVSSGQYFGRQLADILGIEDESILLVDMNTGIIRDLKKGVPDTTAYKIYLLYCALNDADSCKSKPNIFNAKKIVEANPTTGVRIHGLSSFDTINVQSNQGVANDTDTKDIIGSVFSSINAYNQTTGYPFSIVSQDWYRGNTQHNAMISPPSTNARVDNNKKNVIPAIEAILQSSTTQPPNYTQELALQIFKKKSGDYYQILLAIILYYLFYGGYGNIVTFFIVNCNGNDFRRTPYTLPAQPSPPSENNFRKKVFLLTGDFPCLAKAFDSDVNVLFKCNGFIMSFIKNR